MSTASPLSREKRPGPQILREISGNGFALQLAQYPAGHRQKWHSHNHHGISFLISGGIRERVQRSEEDATPYSLVIKPAGVSHCDWIGPTGARLVQIKFTADCQLWPASCIDVDKNWRWLHKGPALREMLSLLALLLSNSSAPDSIAEEETVNLLAGVTGMEAVARGPAPRWLRWIKQQLDDTARLSLSVRQLADRAGVHPVYLARAFRRHYGTSITQYRKRARFCLAAATLSHSGSNLCEIAHACGYTDHAHFCRDLRTLTGSRPGSIRALLSRVSSVQETRCQRHLDWKTDQ
ncbi:AraC family transcriptional regulator [Microbulbifer sp. SAOS-129_SWC]|uniref:AraC family transcriptional regulator n=1 Tax=Microbulbifer sp. SAOS-129_SWC TaxID=3145235 RepID=UPI0032165FFD